MTPPHDTDAERALLGSIMLDPKVMDTVADLVHADSFYRKSHSTIYLSMALMYAKSIPIDLVSLKDHLTTTGDLDAVGGTAYLLEIASAVPTSHNAKRYAEIITRATLLRQVAKTGSEIARYGYDPAHTEVDAILSDIESMLTPLHSHSPDTIATLPEEADKLYATLYRQHENPSLLGLPTTLTPLNNMLDGLVPGRLIICAARPSVGKSAFLENVTLHVAETGTPVYLACIEQTVQDVLLRMACSKALYDSHKAKQGLLLPHELTELMDTIYDITKLPIIFDDLYNATPDRIMSHASRAIRRDNVGLVLIDHLHILTLDARLNRNDGLGEATKAFKGLAKQHDVPVLAASQLRRADPKASSREPDLQDLRDSGNIEQDADQVFFIDRRTDPETGRIIHKFICAKNRHGPIGEFPVDYSGPHTRFYQIAQYT
ncbi:MAG: replicative DNA helicase [Anaerosomatales bacterium]|nr:replicative DNA helicase [Anaerosomatales bacterium]